MPLEREDPRAGDAGHAALSRAPLRTGPCSGSIVAGSQARDAGDVPLDERSPPRRSPRPSGPTTWPAAAATLAASTWSCSARRPAEPGRTVPAIAATWRCSGESHTGGRCRRQPCPRRRRRAARTEHPRRGDRRGHRGQPPGRPPRRPGGIDVELLSTASCRARSNRAGDRGHVVLLGRKPYCRSMSPGSQAPRRRRRAARTEHPHRGDAAAIGANHLAGRRGDPGGIDVELLSTASWQSQVRTVPGDRGHVALLGRKPYWQPMSPAAMPSTPATCRSNGTSPSRRRGGHRGQPPGRPPRRPWRHRRGAAQHGVLQSQVEPCRRSRPRCCSGESHTCRSMSPAARALDAGDAPLEREHPHRGDAAAIELEPPKPPKRRVEVSGPFDRRRGRRGPGPVAIAAGGGGVRRITWPVEFHPSGKRLNRWCCGRPKDRNRLKVVPQTGPKPGRFQPSLQVTAWYNGWPFWELNYVYRTASHAGRAAERAWKINARRTPKRRTPRWIGPTTRSHGPPNSSALSLAIYSLRNDDGKFYCFSDPHRPADKRRAVQRRHVARRATRGSAVSPRNTRRRPAASRRRKSGWPPVCRTAAAPSPSMLGKGGPLSNDFGFNTQFELASSANKNEALFAPRRDDSAGQGIVAVGDVRADRIEPRGGPDGRGDRRGQAEDRPCPGRRHARNGGRAQLRSFNAGAWDSRTRPRALAADVRIRPGRGRYVDGHEGFSAYLQPVCSSRTRSPPISAARSSTRARRRWASE